MKSRYVDEKRHSLAIKVLSRPHPTKASTFLGPANRTNGTKLENETTRRPNSHSQCLFRNKAPTLKRKCSIPSIINHPIVAAICRPSFLRLGVLLVAALD